MKIGSGMPKNDRKNNKNMPVKAYNMAILDDDSAEINMYGDVYMEAPRDWWTGDKIEGQYIAADDFLDDLEQIKNKSNITIHINSGGGDLYAGLAIYNRLKELSGHVTTINDAMAASAASLIFQAGDTRKMNSASNLMAHGVGGFLFGYYMIDDLKSLVTQYKAHNKAIVNVYAEAMGVAYDDAKNFVEGETWLTGQEAIDKGLADEVIKEDDDEAETNFFNTLARKLPRHMAMFGIPENSAIPAAAPQDADIEKNGGKEMIKTTNELREAYPELVAQIENAAADKGKLEGQKSERERIKGIEDIATAVLDDEMLAEAKFGESTLTAAELSLAVMKDQAKIGSTMLNSLEADTKKSGAENVKAAPKNAEDDDPDEEEEKKKEEEAKNIGKTVNKIVRGV